MTLEARRHATVAAFLMRGMRAVNDPQVIPTLSERRTAVVPQPNTRSNTRSNTLFSPQFGPIPASKGRITTLTMAVTGAPGARHGLVAQIGRT